MIYFKNMGQYNTKIDQDYDNLVYIMEDMAYGWNSHYDCELILKNNSLLINLKAYKLVKENPDLIINLIKVYPEAKIYLNDILGESNLKNISIELDDYNL